VADVLINFVSGDQSGLKTASDGLENLTEKDKALQEQHKATAAAFDLLTKKMIDGTGGAAKSIADLVASTKNLDKSVIGAAYTKSLKDIQSQLQLTNVEVIKYLQNTKQTAQAALINSKDEKEIK